MTVEAVEAAGRPQVVRTSSFLKPNELAVNFLVSLADDFEEVDENFGDDNHIYIYTHS